MMTEAIIDLARHGDERAWRVIYDELAPAVAGYFRARRVRDAEDLVGEVFLGIARGIGQFAGDESRFRAWVFKIAHSRYVDWVRASDRRPEDPVDDFVDERADGDTESEVMDRLRREELLVHVDGLPDAQRSVVLLRVLADLPLVEIAEVLGKTPVAVRVAFFRAVRRLEASLTDGWLVQPDARAAFEAGEGV